jgi:hypothetical protein
MVNGLKKMISVEEVLAFLNEALLLDQDAVSNLVETRFPCNAAMANHPTIQVSGEPDGKSPKVGFLGVLNGMFGADEGGYGPFTMDVTDDGTVLRFYKTPSPLERQ